MAKLIPDKVDCSARDTTRNKKKDFIMIKNDINDFDK